MTTTTAETATDSVTLSHSPQSFSALPFSFPPKWPLKTPGMPYTPPSHRSPASSAPSSPNSSRRSSFHGTPTSPQRQCLPRSTSYASRHRRTPSISASPSSPSPGDVSTPDITPPGTSDDLKGMLTSRSPSIRQSPPPVADSRAMPPGAMISPPESSSEDEEAGDDSQHGREIENLDELKEAISAIPQHRKSSPTRKPSPGDLLVLPSQMTNSRLADGPSKQSLATTMLPALDTRPSTTGRKVSHTRSATEPSIFVSKSEPDFAVVISDDNSDGDDPLQKPQMVRKKSGELVRPALRPAAHRRPSSVPGTPVYSKAVHFDSHLEHVRHFLQVDRPLAVSAGTSPNEEYESEAEYPFGAVGKTAPGSTAQQWEIHVRNFPTETPLRKGLPARLERVWLSSDHKSMIGSVVVANLAFQKSVVCRFTFDYWKTVSEVSAEYSQTVQGVAPEAGQDRFQFSIKLSDIASLESKTLFLCVRYSVKGLDYWDNNDNSNFQVDFQKKQDPQPTRGNSVGSSSQPQLALPRSNRRNTRVPRPKSMPVGAFDDFNHGGDLASLNQPIQEFLGDPGLTIKLKSNKSSSNLPSDNLPARLPAPSGQAFGHRYDFGASLNATVRGGRDSPPRKQSDTLYMKSNTREAFTPGLVETPSSQSAAAPKLAFDVPSGPSSSMPHNKSKPSGAPALTTSGTDSPSANIASASYEEILSKYCFFGSKQSSPQFSNGAAEKGPFADKNESCAHGSHIPKSSVENNPGSSESSRRGALHQTLRENLDPYFQNMHISATGASPVGTPLNHPGSPSSQTRSQADSTPTFGSSSSSPMAGFAPLTAIRG